MVSALRTLGGYYGTSHAAQMVSRGIGLTPQGFGHALTMCYSHIYSYINVRFLHSLSVSAPSSIPDSSEHFQPSLIPPAVHDDPDGISAYTGAKLFHLRDAKRTHYVLKGIFHDFGLGPALWSRPFRPVFKFPIRSSPD